MEEEPIIKVDKLRIVYNKNSPAESVALQGVSIDVMPHEFVIIFGPSGCGKSTLLYSMSGIERHVDEGAIYVKNKNLVTLSAEEQLLLHRKDIGMIFQAYNLIPTLNVLDNVSLPLVADGVKKSERNAKAALLLSRFGISQFADRFPQNLSGGQQQRVAIARALISNPDIILADEPTGNLDSASAKTVMETLINLNEEAKKTIVLVTHAPDYLQYAHRVVHIMDGRVTRIEVKNDMKVKRELKVPSTLPIDLLQIKKGSASEKDDLHANDDVFFNTRALARYFDWSFNDEEKERFEEIARKFMAGNFSKDLLFEALHEPFREGGMGFYKQRAIHLTNEIDEILSLSRSLKQCIKDKKDIGMKIGHVAEWLLRDYSGEVSGKQHERIKAGVLKRVSGEYDRHQLQQFLDIPFDDGGVGFHWQTARNLARKLEVIFE